MKTANVVSLVFLAGVAVLLCGPRLTRLLRARKDARRLAEMEAREAERETLWTQLEARTQARQEADTAALLARVEAFLAAEAARKGGQR